MCTVERWVFTIVIHVHTEWTLCGLYLQQKVIELCNRDSGFIQSRITDTKQNYINALSVHYKFTLVLWLKPGYVTSERGHNPSSHLEMKSSIHKKPNTLLLYPNTFRGLTWSDVTV